jgi:hypothetical protein
VKKLAKVHLVGCRFFGGDSPFLTDLYLKKKEKISFFFTFYGLNLFFKSLDHFSAKKKTKNSVKKIYLKKNF